MKVLNVGGLNPIRRHKTLSDALDKAGHDDTINLHKKTTIQHVIKRPLTIDANNKELFVPAGKAGLIVDHPIIIKNARIRISSRSNGLVLRKGAILQNVKVIIDGPIHEFYPAIYHESGNLLIQDSEIQKLVTLDQSFVEIKNSKLYDYYGSTLALSDNSNMNLLRGNIMISDSELSSTMFLGKSVVKHSVIGAYNYNAKGADMRVHQTSFTHIEIPNKVNMKKEPEHGPLSGLIDISPYLLYNEGDLFLDNYTSHDTNDHYITLSQGGSIDVVNTRNTDEVGEHFIANTSIGFLDTVDSSYYHVKDSVASQVKSQVRLSQKTQTATEKLEELIGLSEVKRTITNVMNTIQVNQKSANKDFEFSYHMIFAGDPGTGKTTVAKIVAQALFEIGAVPENKLTEVTVDKLIKGYIGQTAANVREILDEALGGVLFIDEAYELSVKENQNSFNSEALSVIIRYMEDHRDDLVVIAAGYTKEMREFLASNVGLQRRFQWVDFQDYSSQEMASIFELMRVSHGKDYESKKLQTIISPLFDKLTGIYLSKPDTNGRVTNGGNGGLVRNVYQQVVQEYNNRMVQDSNPSEKILQNDILTGFKYEMEKALKT